MKKKSETDPGRKAREESQEAAEVSEWAEQWGEGFWKHVPIVRLGDPEFVEPDWNQDVYGGRRGHR